MICIFHDGLLRGLQFEIDSPPHRIRVRGIIPEPIVGAHWNLDPMAASYRQSYDEYEAITAQVDSACLNAELEGQVVIYRATRGQRDPFETENKELLELRIRINRLEKKLAP